MTHSVVRSALLDLWLHGLAPRWVPGLAGLRIGWRWTLAYPGCLLRFSTFLVLCLKSSLVVTLSCYSFISVLNYRLGYLFLNVLLVCPFFCILFLSIVDLCSCTDFF